MKITNRQLKRIIREAIHNPGDDALIDALTFGWAQWADDNGQPDPGLFAPQEKGDAALSWVSNNEPDIARQINALSTHNLKALYDAAFDYDADRGHRTSAMDWLPRVDEVKITRQQLRRIIREAHGGAKGSYPDRYGDAHEKYTSRAGTLGEESENYVLERSGVGWGEKFFVELTGRNDVIWGPLAGAQKFKDTPSAEEVQKEIDRIEGFYTRIRPSSFFE